ncbi:hypothetical protein [Butyricimonas paravirosa]|jgi:hypothetical protein|uniref:hypothetical protein n=1 Tax=Butyricimonas paravirosa TaxID=1472417 RepID=UPI0026DA9E44|nr:hypothetical protein [Butyricimonas paravirosa]
MKEWMKYKNLGKLLGMLLLVPVIAWFFGFRETISIWHDYKEMKERIQRLQAGPVNGQSSDWENNWNGEAVLRDGRLLGKLSGILAKENVNVDSYTPNVVREENSTRVDAGMLVLAGNYISLVKLLDFVEKDNTLGKVTSVTFQVFPDRVRKSKQLKMTIWIQQLSVVWHD